MAETTITKTNTVIKIKENCFSRKKPNSKAEKISTLSKDRQFYVYAKTTTKTGTFYRISEKGGKEASWVNAKFCKLLTEKQITKAEKKGNISTSTYNGKDAKGKGDHLVGAAALDESIKSLVSNKRSILASTIDGSTRMFGMPHQMTSYTDKRISKTIDLGTVFTEKFVMDAPVIYLKPGTSNFLPGMSNSEKKNIVSSIIQSASDSKSKALSSALSGMEDNDWRYFDFKEDYAAYIRNVNVLCRMCAIFLGIHKKNVPWEAGTGKSSLTYGSYDWSGYTFETLFSSTKNAKASAKSGVNLKNAVTSLFKDPLKVVKGATASLLSDDNFVKFYVDASVGFQESVSNSTSQSMVSSFIDNLSSLGQEVSFVSGATGIDIDKVMESTGSTIDSAVNKVLKGDGAISTLLKRLTGTGKQVIAGSNFIAPEVWSSAEYSKSYSFTVTLSTPYADTEAWYLNIAVPLMHLLALALPRQKSANTYNAPFLVRAYSPGWFSCDIGVIESMSIDKAPSGDAWGSNGLPLEIKIGINIKELYSSLSIPDDVNFKAFFANTGLMNYLMINCGVDITKQTLDMNVAVFVNIFKNTIQDGLKEFTTSIFSNIKETLRGSFNLFT